MGPSPTCLSTHVALIHLSSCCWAPRTTWPPGVSWLSLPPEASVQLNIPEGKHEISDRLGAGENIVFLCKCKVQS